MNDSSPNSRPTFLVADDLTMTGPGKRRMDVAEDPCGNLLPGVFDLESFWGALKNKQFIFKKRLAIVGAGENAASALLALAGSSDELEVDVISPRGFISTRSESYYENRVYSQPGKNGWTELDLADRADFIERTDLGVFSTHAMSILTEQVGHRIMAGRMVGLEHRGPDLLMKLEYKQQIRKQPYDQVILATGFDQISALRSLFTPRALRALEHAVGVPLTDQVLGLQIQTDLSVRGMQPRLHLPALAALTQGPGFSNLSCLGLLSDRMITGLARKQPLALAR